MKKTLDVNNIKEKAVRILKKTLSETNVQINEQVEKELLFAISTQPVDGMEEMIAENLARSIVNDINVQVAKNKVKN